MLGLRLRLGACRPCADSGLPLESLLHPDLCSSKPPWKARAPGPSLSHPSAWPINACACFSREAHGETASAGAGAGGVDGEEEGDANIACFFTFDVRRDGLYQAALNSEFEMVQEGQALSRYSREALKKMANAPRNRRASKCRENTTHFTRMFCCRDHIFFKRCLEADEQPRPKKAAGDFAERSRHKGLLRGDGVRLIAARTVAFACVGETISHRCHTFCRPCATCFSLQLLFPPSHSSLNLILAFYTNSSKKEKL